MSYVRFKYLLNRMITIDQNYYAIPMRQVPTQVSTMYGDQTVLMPTFLMDETTFTIELGILTPAPVRRRKEHTDAFHDKLVEQSYIAAIEARAKCETILARVRGYVKSGVIVVTSDPDGLLDEIGPSAEERAVAGLPAQEAPRDPNVTRIPDLIAESNALKGVK